MNRIRKEMRRKKNEKINGESDFCFPMFFRFDFGSNAKFTKTKKKLIGRIDAPGSRLSDSWQPGKKK